MQRIVIVDDDRMFAETLAQLLRTPGCEVTCVSVAAQAVPTLAQQPPDLVVLDVMFPEEPAAGFVIARSIRRTEGIKNLPIMSRLRNMRLTSQAH